jgi:hypothetical protein
MESQEEFLSLMSQQEEIISGNTNLEDEVQLF